MRGYVIATMATVLALGTAGAAHADPLVTNGDFSAISTATGVNPGTPSQLNYTPPATLQDLFPENYGEFVTGWTTIANPADLLFEPQNVIWSPSASAASGTNAEDIDTSPAADLLLGLGYVSRPLFPTTLKAPPDGGAFIAMQSNVTNLMGQRDSGIQQTISGLTLDQSYTLTFDWAATMDNIDTYSGETSYLTASIAGKSLTTTPETVSSDSGPPSMLGLPTHSTPTFSGWLPESLDFVAHSASSTLQFLAGGSPQGLPPYALLSNVSITPKAVPPTPPTSVPEPGSLALLGTGLVGLGVLLRRRRSA